MPRDLQFKQQSNTKISIASVHPETGDLTRDSKIWGLEEVSNIASASLFSADASLIKSI